MSDGSVKKALYVTNPGDSSAISATDINQGTLGDCYLLSAIAEEAYYNPSLISNIIHDNGDGTQTVTLFGSASIPGLKTEQITVVDANLSASGVNGSGQDVVAGVQELWPAVLENAYAQISGGYSAIGNGGLPIFGFSALNGANASAGSTSGLTEAGLKALQSSGDLIVLSTSATGALPYGLINDHSYFYKGITTVGGVDYVNVGNPWGYNQAAPIPVSALSTAFAEIDTSYSPSVPAAAPQTGLVVYVEEDAYQGDAQFTVTVDGQQVGGAYSATTSHTRSAGSGEIVPQSVTIGQGLAAGVHKVGVSFINDAYGGSATADRNLYVIGAAYNGSAIYGAQSTLLSNGTDSFNVLSNSAGGSPAPAPAPAPTPAPAPAPVPVPAPSQGLVVSVQEDAWQGDAQFTVTVDGQQVGGVQTATAAHNSGSASQSVLVVSNLAAGTHQVGVSFINDAWGGTSSTDRNLYVTGASYNGTQVPNAAATLLSNGTDSFAVSVPGSAVTSNATINLSEDGWQGDAQFTVSIDGKQQGGVYTATSSHSAGQTQSFQFSAIPETFAGHDVAVSFINDAYGGTSSTDRNLYVDSVKFDNQSVSGGNAALYSNGTAHFQAVAPNGWTGG